MPKFVKGMALLKLLPAVTALFLAAPGLAQAADCSAQTGKLIFEDTFADDTGGWDVDPDASYGKPALTLKLQGTSSWIYPNNTFNATDGDYCLEAVVPKPAAADNLTYVGLGTLYTDAKNFVLLQVDSNGGISVWRKAAGKWTRLSNTTDATIKPDSVVVLRVVVNGPLLTASVNGNEVKKVRVQIPEGALNFGIYAQLDKAVPAPGIDVHFNRFRLTSLQ